MLLIPCPWCGPRDEAEFRYGGQARSVVSERPRGALRRAVGRLPVHAGQPEGRLRGAVDACSRVPAVVRRRPRHIDGRDPRRVGMRRPGTGGDAIDRSRALSFTFDDRELSGFEGDTLASALLANGVDVVCRSPIQGRPRGVYSAGAEEPCAFVGLDAPFVDPVVAATTVDLVDGLIAHGVPGVGRLPAEGVPPVRSEHRHAHVETLVIGASVEGVSEANAAAARGDRSMLVESRGWLPREVSPDVDVLARATALGVYDDGYVLIHQRSRPVERVWHVRARNVVLATGRARASDRVRRQRPPRSDAGHVRPDVPRSLRGGAGHAGGGVHDEPPRSRGRVRAGGRRRRDRGDRGRRRRQAARRPTPRERGGSTSAAGGRSPGPRASRASPPCTSRVRPASGTRSTPTCCSSPAGGARSSSSGARSAAASATTSRARASSRTATGPSWLSVVGAAAGDVPTSEPYWFVPADDYAQHYVDMQRDQTVADVLDAVEHDLRSVEHIKRATYIGTALDQGRTSGVLTAAIVNQALGAGPDAQGPTNARPPYTPVSFAALAGADRGHLFDPARVTPIHAWHVERGAAFENVGQWKRPWYFPADASESMDDGGPPRRAGGPDRRRRDGRVDARQDRRRSGPTRRRSSTGCTRTACRRSAPGRSATG